MPEQIPLDSRNREQKKSDLAKKIIQLRNEGKTFVPVTSEETELYSEIFADEREDDQPRFGNYRKHG